MSLPILQNNLVPLCFIAHDRDEDLFIRVTLFNAVTGAVLTTITLTHIADGRYTDASYFMPAIDVIKAYYEPFTDAGFTALSNVHSSQDQYFNLAKENPALVRNDEIEAVFVDSIDEINGVLSSEEIAFQLIDQDVAIVGIVNGSDEITASFESDELIGVVGC